MRRITGTGELWQVRLDPVNMASGRWGSLRVQLWRGVCGAAASPNLTGSGTCGQVHRWLVPCISAIMFGTVINIVGFAQSCCAGIIIPLNCQLPSHLLVKFLWFICSSSIPHISPIFSTLIIAETLINSTWIRNMPSFRFVFVREFLGQIKMSTARRIGRVRFERLYIQMLVFWILFLIWSSTRRKFLLTIRSDWISRWIPAVCCWCIQPVS